MAEFNADGLNRVSGRSSTSLGLSIGSLALWALNGGLNNGLGGILGGGNGGAINGAINAKDDKIDFLSDELMREKSERYTDKSICELKSLMYDKFDAMNASVNSRFNDVSNTLNGIALVNNSTANTLSCLTNTVNALSTAFNNVTITGISSAKVLSTTTTTT